MKKIILSSLFILIGMNFSNAQEIEIKDDKVLLDGKPILKYEKINLEQHSFYSLDDNEILMFKWMDNETKNYKDDDFYVLNFLTLKKKIESSDFTKIVSGMGLSSKKNMEKTIKWLIKEKVIDSSGNLNAEKLDVFFEKYDEKITERTTR